VLPELSGRDLVAVLVKYLEHGTERRVVICSAYLPYDSRTLLLPRSWVEFLDASGLEILNRGKRPTFCYGYRLEVINITLGSFGLLDNIENWEVSMEPSLSDHRHIPFALTGSLPARLSRNPRGTKWDSFREELRDSLSRDPMEYTRDEVGLGLALQ
jgi:hypothetical protein